MNQSVHGNVCKLKREEMNEKKIGFIEEKQKPYELFDMKPSSLR
jgi:hypothetical protein